MVYTLGQAAKATGKTKTTIAKAIAKGRISAQKDDIGQYVIDPSELHRVYPLTVENNDKVDDSRPSGDHILLLEIATLKAKLEAMDKLNRQIEAERDRIHEQNTRITALLAAPKADPYAALLERLEAIEKEVVATNHAPVAEPPRKSLWRRLMG
jgi:hypothetical protein